MSATSDDTVRWHVCHTKPRCEKKFAATLVSVGFEHYLPLVASVRNYSFGKIKQFSKPLFPSYVFARVPMLEKRRIYEQQLLVRALSVQDERTFLAQIEQVKLVIASDLAVAPRPMMTKGERVRVLSGPLWGVEGIVDDPVNPQGIVIAVDVLQQGLLVKIPLGNLMVLP